MQIPQRTFKVGKTKRRKHGVQLHFQVVSFATRLLLPRSRLTHDTTVSFAKGETGGGKRQLKVRMMMRHLKKEEERPKKRKTELTKARVEGRAS